MHKVLGKIHAPVLCMCVVGFPSLQTTHTEFVTPVLAAPFKGLCFTCVTFGSWYLCSNCSFWKTFQTFLPRRLLVNRTSSFGRNEATRQTQRTVSVHTCLCPQSYGGTDISAEITVPLSFLWSLRSFPFSIYVKKIFIGVREVVTRTQPKMRCSRKEPKFLVAAAGQTPSLGSVPHMRGVPALEVLSSRQGCHRAAPWSSDGEILHLRRKETVTEPSQQKDTSLRKPKPTPQKLQNSRKRCSGCNVWWNMDQRNCFLCCWSISKRNTETLSVVLPLHTWVAAANSLSSLTCWQHQASWFIFRAVLNIREDNAYHRIWGRGYSRWVKCILNQSRLTSTYLSVCSSEHLWAGIHQGALRAATVICWSSLDKPQ